MATPTWTKRLPKERERMSKDNKEYFVNWKDEDLRRFDAYIIGPEDSVYKCKLIKLRFEIPDSYPLRPPKVTFIQHRGNRIHPNLYVDGKVCLSILGTWAGPSWAYSMGIETVLVSIRSLLDNRPYLHEPNQSDDPAWNEYVRHATWRWLLLDYLDNEQDPTAKEFLQRYLAENGSAITGELERQRINNTSMEFTSRNYRQDTMKPEYTTFYKDLYRKFINAQRLYPTQATGPVGESQKRPPEESSSSENQDSQPDSKRRKPESASEAMGKSQDPQPDSKQEKPKFASEVIDLTED